MKGESKRFISRFLTIVTVLALCFTLVITVYADVLADDDTQSEVLSPQYVYIPTQSVYFYDVSGEYGWAYQAVDYLSALGIIQGTDGYLFAPELSISRADFALMLYRAYNMSDYVTGENFPDIPEGAYYADAVLAAKQLGIASGDEHGNYNPEEEITREDAMVLLHRTLGKAGTELPAGSLSAFSDADAVAEYAADALSGLVSAGIISGDNGMLLPQNSVSRVEIAVMLHRALALETNEENGSVQFEAHPERISICFGDQIFSGVMIENYDARKTYEGLMECLAIEQDEDGTLRVMLGEPVSIAGRAVYRQDILTIDGEEVTLAEDYDVIQVAPYSALDSLQSTGEEYKAALAAYNEDGEAVVIYYAK